MGLVYVGSTAAVALWAWRRESYRAYWELLLPAAIIGVFPAVIVWALLH